MLTRLLVLNALVLTVAAMSLMFVADETGMPASPTDIAAMDQITLTAYPSGF
ncbi:MAG: hypothetical protein JSR90_02525 [Proteobacteria bacterium]|nr:hypothetical protein [Pseudomonadota bacterium]